MASTIGHGPKVALRPAPSYDPPFDDERDPAGWVVPAATPAPGDPSAPRPAPTADDHPPARRAPRRGSVPPIVSPSAETRTAVARFLNTCLEVFNGYRPAAHLRALATPAHANAVVQAMTGATNRVARAAGTPTGSLAVRVKLRRMRICEPRPGIAEVSVVLGAQTEEDDRVASRTGGRCWAVAFRLERLGSHWRCTVIRML